MTRFLKLSIHEAREEYQIQDSKYLWHLRVCMSQMKVSAYPIGAYGGPMLQWKSGGGAGVSCSQWSGCLRCKDGIQILNNIGGCHAPCLLCEYAQTSFKESEKLTVIKLLFFTIFLSYKCQMYFFHHKLIRTGNSPIFVYNYPATTMTKNETVYITVCDILSVTFWCS